MIEHTTLLKDAGLTSGDSNPSIFISALNTILSAYTWKSNSSVNETSSLTSTYGNYYFTGNSYIKIDYFANNQSYLGINLITPNGTKRVQFTVGGHCTISVGKTDKGICICAYSGSSGSREPRFYNLYVGEITLLDGSTTSAVNVASSDMPLSVATIYELSSFTYIQPVVVSTRKAYLVPVIDSKQERFSATCI